MGTYICRVRKVTFGIYAEVHMASTLLGMNNIWTTHTSIPRTSFLAGLAVCRTCASRVQPTATESAFVRIYASRTGMARCDTCYTTADYDLEPRRAA